MSFSDVHPGDPIIASNLQQVIDALKGTAGKGIPLVDSAVNSATNYALTVQNIEATNSRALNVLKSDGSTLVKADATGVTLGAPITVPASSIAGAALQNASVTNAKLASDVARANLLTNGGFEIWQRGNGPFTANGAYAADEWSLAVGGGTLSVTKDTANADGGVGSCSAVTFGGTPNGQDRIIQAFHLTVEQQSLLGRTVTFSARVKCNTANAVRLGANLFVSSNNFVYGSYHSGSGLYETLSLTTTIATNITYFQPGLFASLASTAYLDNAVLAVSPVNVDYVPLHPAEDLARCLRYYEAPGSDGSGSLIVAGPAAAAGNAFRATILWKARKPVTPTVTKVGTWNVQNTAQPTAAGIGIDGCYIQCSSTAAGDTYAYNATAGAYLTSEAHP
jgi:hypothetical protein